MENALRNSHAAARPASHSAVLRMIYQNGPVRRSNIAAGLGLSVPTVTSNVNAMLAEGIVSSEEDGAPANHAIGRPAQIVDIIPDSRHFIGVEMRDCCRSVCVTDFRGTVVYRCRDEVFYDNYEGNMRAAGELILRAAREGPFPLEEINGIGFCMPGLVDPATGVLRYHPRYDWRNRPITADVAALTGFRGPVTAENNVSARATGTKLFQRDHLRGISSFAYLFVATGVACPFVLNASGFRGVLVGPGEVGHMVLDPDGPLCSCGNRGCLEAFSSDHAILAACREALGERAPQTMDEVLQAQERGVPAVERIVDQALRMLGVAITNITNYSCPGVIFIEAKLFRSPANRARLLDYIRQTPYSASFLETKFEFVDADEYSGAVGAAALAVATELDTNGL